LIQILPLLEPQLSEQRLPQLPIQVANPKSPQQDISGSVVPDPWLHQTPKTQRVP
jgi:hypothetical protein